MKTSKVIFGILKLIATAFILAVFMSGIVNGQDVNAREIVRKADEKWRGETSSKSEMVMTIVRPTWKRTIAFKTWTKGRDYALTLITSPAKEKGQTFLKRQNEMWSWNPTIGKLMKLPPSMMSQGWMGSDYTNDDILEQSSIVVDYTHEIVSNETVNGKDCYKIKLTPKPDASVVWGKVILWISKDQYLQLKAEYYDEDMYLVRTEKASKVKEMDDRKIPTHIEIIPADEPGNKTVLDVKSMEFNISINDSFFSQQNMKRVR